MNKLSVMLWLSDALPNFAGVLGGFAILLGIASVIMSIAFVVMKCFPDDEDARRGRKLIKPLLCAFWPTLILLAFISAAIPSQRTILAMTASEVATTPAGQEIMNDTMTLIRQWLKAQIKEVK